MSQLGPGPLADYNSLQDKHLAGFFANTKMKKHLRKSGLVSKDGRVTEDNAYRLKMAKKEHRKHVREMLATAIVHKALDMERMHQYEMKKKLEELYKIELVQRIRAERSRKGEDAFLHLLPSRAHRENSNISHQSKHKEQVETPRTSSDSLPDIYYDKSNRRLHYQNKSPRDDGREMARSKEHPLQKPLVQPHPPNKKKKRKNKPHRGLILARTESAVAHRIQLQSLAEVTVKYLGSKLNLSSDIPSKSNLNEVTVLQQHCGGSTLCVFKEMLSPGTQFSFISRRHRGSPFGLTFYIDSLQDCRLSSCCEYKHKPGQKLGGKNGRFAIVGISGAAPCYRCQVSIAVAESRQKQKERRDQEPETSSDSDEEGPQLSYDIIVSTLKKQKEAKPNENEDKEEKPREDGLETSAKEPGNENLERKEEDGKDTASDGKEEEPPDYDEDAFEEEKDEESERSAAQSDSHSDSSSDSASSLSSSSDSDSEYEQEDREEPSEGKYSDVDEKKDNSDKDEASDGEKEEQDEESIDNNRESADDDHSEAHDSTRIESEEEKSRPEDRDDEKIEEPKGKADNQEETETQSNFEEVEEEDAIKKQIDEHPESTTERVVSSEEEDDKVAHVSTVKVDSDRDDESQDEIKDDEKAKFTEDDDSGAVSNEPPNTAEATTESPDDNVSDNEHPKERSEEETEDPPVDEANSSTSGEEEKKEDINVETIKEDDPSKEEETVGEDSKHAEGDGADDEGRPSTPEKKRDNSDDSDSSISSVSSDEEEETKPMDVPVLAESDNGPFDHGHDPDSVAEVSRSKTPVKHANIEPAVENNGSIVPLITSSKDIELANVTLNEEQVQELAQFLMENEEIDSLTLRNTCLEDKKIDTLMHAVKGKPTLQLVNLNLNNIGRNGAESIADVMRENTNLKVLMLHGNPLEDKGIEVITSAMVDDNLPITSLDFGGCKCDLEGIQSIANMLKRTSTLTDLNLAGNQISLEGWEILSQSLALNDSLKTLSLDFVNLGDEGISVLIEPGLMKNSSLKSIDLEGNNITETGAEKILSALEENKTILDLTLTMNEIGKETMEKISHALSNRLSVG